MSKADRIEKFVGSMGVSPWNGRDPHYLAYFECFNSGQYYEAHDVLEHLWLRQKDENHAFFKGLIQFAGAYVHMKKQFARPGHPTDGRRLHPAVRLLKLALKNWQAYPPVYMGLNLEDLRTHANHLIQTIQAENYARNPWSPDRLPRLSPS